MIPYISRYLADKASYFVKHIADLAADPSGGTGRTFETLFLFLQEKLFCTLRRAILEMLQLVRKKEQGFYVGRSDKRSDDKEGMMDLFENRGVLLFLVQPQLLSSFYLFQLHAKNDD
jgi:hypothetical protein